MDRARQNDGEATTGRPGGRVFPAPCVASAAVLLALVAGCSRQDTESLARLGGKLIEHAHATAEEIGGKLNLQWKEARPEPSVQERVEQRLRTDRMLAETRIEVQVADTEVELRGVVQNPLQRQRAIELAESTRGVEKVNDALQVGE